MNDVDHDWIASRIRQILTRSATMTVKMGASRSIATCAFTLAIVDAMVLPLKPYSPAGQVIISPSVAKANWLALGLDLEAAIAGGADWLHFSVQDGRMVPKISLGSPLVQACREAYPSTVLDVKLGCVEPEHRVGEFAKAGADILSVHPESTLQLAAVLHKIQEAGVAPGVILNPGTSVATVEPVLDQCQVAVVMLVNPGYGGPKYIDQAVAKIRQLRALRSDLHISVDGGVSIKNAAMLLEAGANVLVAGGGIFTAPDKALAIQELQNCRVPPQPTHSIAMKHSEPLRK